MKKLITAFLICFTMIFSSVSSAAIDPKVKMVGTMAGYGVVGGALLGAATMAFGVNGRAIAKGASIGLYAGLLFGGYVILNYEMKKRGYGESKEDYYPESSGPYDKDQSSIKVELEDYRLAQFDHKKKDPKEDPAFFMNLINYSF